MELPEGATDRGCPPRPSATPNANQIDMSIQYALEVTLPNVVRLTGPFYLNYMLNYILAPRYCSEFFAAQCNKYCAGVVPGVGFSTPIKLVAKTVMRRGVAHVHQSVKQIRQDHGQRPPPSPPPSFDHGKPPAQPLEQVAIASAFVY